MSTKSRIHSRAPTRIDLAGGTVDIWPIYLLLEHSLTLNIGIDLFAEATLEIAQASSGDGSILLRSDDQNHEARLSWKELESAKAHPSVDLHLRLLRHFARSSGKGPGFDLSLKTVARSPAGAGLGGSSTLNVAITGALASWAWDRTFDPMTDGEKLIEISRDVETTVIHVPAGLQDYYGAMFGGIQSLNWGAGVHQREWLGTDILAGLEKRVLLFYSGQSRNSGINNWQLFKSFIDQDADVRRKFSEIANATHELKGALLKQDWNAASSAIRKEWAARKTLAAGISTAEMNNAFEIAEKIAPGSAAKVCGAGGGGCFFIYLPEPTSEARSRISEEFVKLGIRPLPFKAVPRGLEVQVTRA
jgi:D-glycero-alpha-D-manno-heptose-7-phosphate kinase